MQIAGAGAGKTYELAEITIKRSRETSKKVYAITFTNFAKNNITKNIIKQNKYIPTNIEINTIHTFLLHKVIYPYSYLMLGKKYNNSTSIKLPENIRYKNLTITRLEKQGIIHNEKVFNIAKQIIVGNKNTNKKAQVKRKIVMEHIKSEIESIFIDESQDINDDVIQIIKKFADNNIYIYMVGDPKQSIKYPGILRTFIKNIEDGEITTFKKQKNKNTTRRIPKDIIKISNMYCPENERQITLSEIDGKISYIYSDDENFDRIYNEYIKNDALVYIQKSTKTFSTKQNKKGKIEFTKFITEELLQNKNKFDDEDAYLKEKCCELNTLINTTENEEQALKEFFRKNNIPIPIPKDKYAEIINVIKGKKSEAKYYADSIDNVKGLEREKCIFILDNAMLDYLFRNKTEENKEMAYLYVGLTRSKEEIILVIDIESTTKTKEYIDQKFREMQIKKYEDTNN